ncbi:MAG: hypothetical protein CL693_11210 [Cellvibrionaceae bacterium]|nr:hypothetical protein [Cellvibrionaceae bacterium]
MILSESWMLEIGLMVSTFVSVLAVVIAIASVSRMRKQAALTQKLYQRLDHNQQVSNSSAMGMGKRLIALEKQLTQRHQDEQVSGKVSRSPASSTGSVIDEELKDAASLVSAGLDADEVARRCGISRAEASLMKLMHSQVHQAA